MIWHYSTVVQWLEIMKLSFKKLVNWYLFHCWAFIAQTFKVYFCRTCFLKSVLSFFLFLPPKKSWCTECNIVGPWNLRNLGNCRPCNVLFILMPTSVASVRKGDNVKQKLLAFFRTSKDSSTKTLKTNLHSKSWRNCESCYSFPGKN